MSEQKLGSCCQIADELSGFKNLTIKLRRRETRHWPLYLRVQNINAALNTFVCRHFFVRNRGDVSFNFFCQPGAPGNHIQKTNKDMIAIRGIQHPRDRLRPLTIKLMRDLTQGEGRSLRIVPIKWIKEKWA